MATSRPVVVNELMCYVTNKYRTLPLKMLKQIILDAYKPEIISGAKVMMMHDLTNTGFDKIPHIPTRRRDSTFNGTKVEVKSATEKEIDDILLIWSIIDENNLWSNVPHYTAGNLSDLPPIHMEEGEFKLLYDKITHLASSIEDDRRHYEELFNHVLVKLEKSSKVIDELRVVNEDLRLQSTLLTNCVALSNSKSQSMPGSQAQKSFLGASALNDHGCISESDSQRGKLSSEANQVTNDDPSGSNKVDLNPSFSKVLQNNLAAQCNSIGSKNDTIIPCDNVAAFQSVLRGRSKRLSLNNDRSQGNNPPKVVSVMKQQADKPLLIGKGNNAVKAAAVAVRRPSLKKKVFYVGNCDVKCQEEDIKTLLTIAGIVYISVSKIGKKRRSGDSQQTNDLDDDAYARRVGRSAFRICIDAKSEAQFLDENLWSEGIVVQHWDFELNRRKAYERFVMSKENCPGPQIVKYNDIPNQMEIRAADEITDVPSEYNREGIFNRDIDLDARALWSDQHSQNSTFEDVLLVSNVNGNNNIS